LTIVLFLLFQFHSDAITSFACSKDGALVATGQMGHRPTVAVWDTRTCTTRFVVPEVQLNAVSCVAFSADKELLAVVNLDRDHTITVYDWKANVAVSKFYGGSNHILGVFFTAPETSREEGVAPGPGLVSYGVKELKIWKGVATRFPTSVRPKIGEQGSLQTFLCGELFLGRPVIGTSDGFLYQFGDTALIKTVKGHSGPLTAMDVNASKKWLVSGGKDGTVRVWSADLACIKEFVVDSLLETVNPSVRSVAFNALGTHIVIGTRAAEIFDVAVTNGAKVGDKSLVEGHGIRQLWGLASHPIKEECITTGDDATLRIWDCRNYVQKRALKMDTASRAVAYSADGKLIAVGFGSGKRVKGKLAPKEGAFSILRAADMKVMHEGKDSNSAIRVVKFSPDGKTFVVASDDNNIYTYNVKDEYSRRSTIKSHQAPVLFVDFSSESNYIVSVDSSRTVCFTEVNSGVTIPTPEALRDEKWVTATSPYSWAVKGFWASQAPGVVPLTVQKSWGGLLVAAGNNAGGVTVAHNPYPRKAGFLHSSGHAGRISSLAWVAGDGALLSIGTKDHALLQWKCLYDNTRESGNEGGRSCEESEMEIDGGHELTQTALRVSGVAANAVPLDGAGSIEQKTPEESLANWYSMICAPSTIHDDDQAVPDAKFELEVKCV
jgi:microtubule-associated protein-like 6